TTKTIIGTNMSKILITLVILFYSLTAMADNLSDSNKLFDWAVSSNFGMHESTAGLTKASSEWTPNTKAKLETQDPTISGLINDVKYAFPQVLPNASYSYYKFKESDIVTFP
ncbi:MAG: hypothetical protein QM479_00615, partial [Pseudomonadota bacterium]